MRWVLSGYFPAFPRRDPFGGPQVDEISMAVVTSIPFAADAALSIKPLDVLCTIPEYIGARPNRSLK